MLAQTVLQACLDLGVRDFCVCAGSRNSDLVHGLLRNRDKIRIFPFFEERCAAFFALGLLQMRRTPVAVVTTSGTAVAELLPAVIEAYYQARPLLLITADRPKRYRGSGAPQAIDQRQIFGGYARAFDIESDQDVIDLTTLAQDRPIHLNVCLEEPSGESPKITLNLSDSDKCAAPSVSSNNHSHLETFLQQDSPLLVIAGCLDPHEDLIDALLHLKAPILADATSGLHAEPSLHPLLIRGGDQTARGLSFSRVLRIGGVPSFRTWRDLETKPEIEVFSLTQRPFSGLARPSQWILGDTVPLVRTQQTPSRWREEEAANAERLEALLDQYPECEPACLRRLLTAIPSQAQLFVGNSLPIRELSLVAARAMPWPVFSNRGANGIDGNLSTFLGIARGAEALESWGIFGDLTTLYDLAAPAILAEMQEAPPLRIVVIHNGGGKIFRRLPHFQGLSPRDTAVVENHHGFDFESWAQSWGMDYQRLTKSPIDPQALPARVVLEVRPQDAQTEAFWDSWQNPEIR